MAITEKSIKLLWSNAAGRCSFDGCRVRLSQREAEGRAPYTIGEMAHIRGNKPGANRHDTSQTSAERDDYTNLILLCPNHHTEIDEKQNEGVFTVAILHKMKTKHEDWVDQRTDTDESLERQTLAQSILVLLEENHQSWLTYGPMSELALSEPHNDEVFSIWVSERLSTIVPNNRKITGLLERHRGALDPDDQKAISAFLLHSRSYESWVNDEISYAGVLRFPAEFADRIRRAANGGA